MHPAASSKEAQAGRRPYSLGDWDNRSAVRSRKSSYQLPPHSELEQELQTRDWFPPAFIPYFADPAVQHAGRTVQQRLAANHLVYFLHYTTILEHKIVNRSVETLIHGELAIELPKTMKIAALQLYTDEGYHALFSFKLAEQVANGYAMPAWQPLPRRIRLMHDLLARCADSQRPLAWFLLGFVSETIIAKELLSITGDGLVSTVYQMFREHLEDEARHSRYFSEVFDYVWARLSPQQQVFSASQLIDIIFIFAAVDQEWLSASLNEAGIPLAAAHAAIHSLIQPSAEVLRARSIAGATLQAMKRAGFFEHDDNRRLFTQTGLIDA
ncbi:hypothetical protein ABH911_001615 [Pseudomonas protegens]|uniref:diiron oxygenase n=1 Tax=Pseudomonas protegens TaxID=380021 RepID=UPI003514F0BC